MRRPLILLTLLAIVSASVGIPTPWLLLLGFLVVTPLERLRPRVVQPLVRRGLSADVAHVLITFPIAFVLGLVPVRLVERFAPDPPTLVGAIADAPLFVQAFVGLLAVEFVDYWIHRALHEVPLLWRLHQVHHTIEQMDWVAGARVHPLSVVFSTSMRSVPLALIGFDLRLVAPLAILGAASAILTHANLDVRLRPLRKIWVTPDFHHWHHAAEAEAYDTNYGGLLPVWDLVFGTYHLPDRRPSGYGIDTPDPGTWRGHLALPFRRPAVGVDDVGHLTH